jgi:sugar O-acyltransferase (sialic acid O-acetyltransferase NeuD family)
MAPTAEPLLLVAASGLAREVLAVIRTHKLYDVIGFLDDSPSLAGGLVDGVPVLGPVDQLTSYPNAQVLVCAGRGTVRERIVSRLTGLGVDDGRFASVVHPSIEVSQGSSVDLGSILLGGVAMTTAVSIGKHVVVMPNATLTHDCVLEDYATVCAGVTLGGNVVVKIGAYLGMNASVRERVVVGKDAVLGMGSVLLNNLPTGETWAGAPARPLRDQDKAEARKAGEL